MGTVSLVVEQAPVQGALLKLRIPFWSETTSLQVGAKQLPATAGSYVTVAVNTGDVISLELDMSLRAWAGEERLQGKASLFRGPLVLCADAFYDRRLNVLDLPTLDTSTLRLTGMEKDPRAGYRFCLQDQNRTITVCDLYTAGSSGSPYSTWFPVKTLPIRAFTRDNPFRLQKVGG